MLSPWTWLAMVSGYDFTLNGTNSLNTRDRNISVGAACDRSSFVPVQLRRQMALLLPPRLDLILQREHGKGGKPVLTHIIGSYVRETRGQMTVGSLQHG